MYPSVVLHVAVDSRYPLGGIALRAWVASQQIAIKMLIIGPRAETNGVRIE